MLRRRLASVLDRLGLIEHVLAHARWLPVLAYHRIRRGLDRFDQGVVDATPEALDWQLTELSRHFEVITCDQLLDGDVPPHAAMVTFDDGYRECITEALPVLERHGIPATFFVVTGDIAERRVFWWDRIAYALHETALEHIRMSYPKPLELDLTEGRERGIRTLLSVVKATPALDFSRFLRELYQRGEVPWTPQDERHWADVLVMSWDDVRALRDAGMQIGSHTRTHRILQNVPAEELADELRGSRDDLRRELSADVRVVSYPVGRPISGSPSVVAAVRDAGYTLGFSTGVHWLPKTTHSLDLARICLDPDITAPELRALLAHPAFAG